MFDATGVRKKSFSEPPTDCAIYVNVHNLNRFPVTMNTWLFNEERRESLPWSFLVSDQLLKHNTKSTIKCILKNLSAGQHSYAGWSLFIDQLSPMPMWQRKLTMQWWSLRLVIKHSCLSRTPWFMKLTLVTQKPQTPCVMTNWHLNSFSSLLSWRKSWNIFNFVKLLSIFGSFSETRDSLGLVSWYQFGYLETKQSTTSH